MNEKILNFLITKQIDSFQKLRLLLFLMQLPDLRGTCYDLANRLYLGDIQLLEKMTADLTSVGLLTKTETAWQLCDEPETRANLGDLSKLYDSPLTRQDLLASVMRTASS
jgi:hypothetical protein